MLLIKWDRHSNNVNGGWPSEDWLLLWEPRDPVGVEAGPRWREGLPFPGKPAASGCRSLAWLAKSAWLEGNPFACYWSQSQLDRNL